MLANVCAFIFHARVSRLLGVTDYGALYALMALLPLAGVPAAALATVVTKLAAELHALDDRAGIGALIRALTRALGLTALVTAAAGILLQIPISAFLNVHRDAVVATGVVIGVTIALPALRAVLQGVEDFSRYALSWAAEAVLKMVLGISFALLGWGVTGALAGYAIGGGIAAVYTCLALRGKGASPPRGDVKLDLRRLLHTTGGALVLIATFTALSYGDSLIVKHFMSAADAGLYAAVSLSGKVMLYLTSFIPLVLLPKVANRATTGGQPAPILRAALIMWAALTAVALIPFYFAPGVLVRTLVGAKFEPAASLLFPYALAMALLGVMNVIASYKIALHRFDFTYPFAALTIAELGTIAVYHPSLQAVIRVLLIGNTCGVLASLYRIGHVRGARPATQ